MHLFGDPSFHTELHCHHPSHHLQPCRWSSFTSVAVTRFPGLRPICKGMQMWMLFATSFDCWVWNPHRMNAMEKRGHGWWEGRDVGCCVFFLQNGGASKLSSNNLLSWKFGRKPLELWHHHLQHPHGDDYCDASCNDNLICCSCVSELLHLKADMIRNYRIWWQLFLAHKALMLEYRKHSRINLSIFC